MEMTLAFAVLMNITGEFQLSVAVIKVQGFMLCFLNGDRWPERAVILQIIRHDRQMAYMLQPYRMTDICI